LGAAHNPFFVAVGADKDRRSGPSEGSLCRLVLIPKSNFSE
jgi:hypothetical protein